MPATGTPEPGGLSWYESAALLRATIDAATLVGCDIVELCPIAGASSRQFPVREADLQDCSLLLRERPAVAPRWGLTPRERKMR